MASLVTVGEYEGASETAKGFITEQELDFSGGVDTSSAFNSLTTRIRVAADTACRIKIGSGVTALSTSQFLFANQVEYFTVEKGAGWVISAIAA